MTAVSAKDVDRATASRGRDVNLLLFYGPDAGRVSERARLAAQAAIDDPADPFQLIRLDGETLAEAPARLVEEASTFGLFGGRRAIWVRSSGRNIAPAVVACLDVALSDTIVVIEAGELAKSSPLRTACERSPRALALPCYPDEARDLAAVIAETLRSYGLAIDKETRDLLAESLGGDRLATRGELEKLALYAHGRNSVTADDVAAVVSDVSPVGTDAAIDAAFLGDRAALDAGLAQLGREGVAPSGLLALAIRHNLALLGQRIRVEQGEDVGSAMRSWRGLHFRRQPAAQRQLSAWSSADLAGALRRLQDAALDARRSPALGAASTAQALLAIAGRARAGGA